MPADSTMNQRLLSSADTRAGTPAGGVTVRATQLLLVDPRRAARIAAPPYDAVAPSQRNRIAARDPDNFLNVLQPLRPDAPVDVQQAVLAHNVRALAELQARDVFRPWPRPAMGVYRLVDGDHTQTGFVAAVAVRDYEEGRILPHEFTHPAREQILARYLDAVGMVSSPVALAYRNEPVLSAAIDDITAGAPTIDFTDDDGLRQTVWMADAPDILADVVAAFATTPRLYVTDGHHRLVAAVIHAGNRRLRAGAAREASELGEQQSWTDPAAAWEYALAVLFPHDQLRAESFNRCVTPPAGRSPGDLLDDLSARMRLRELGRAPRTRPDDGETTEPGPRQFAMLLDGRWYLIDVGDIDAGDVDAKGATPDAALLQDLVLAPVFGIEDPRTDPRLDHLAGATDVSALEQRCRDTGEAAFLLNAPTMEQLMAVSDARVMMPPKSTWFHPKIRSGIFLRSVR